MADPSIDNLRNALEELTGVMRNTTDSMARMGEANTASDAERKKSIDMFNNAITGSAKSLQSFASTVMNTERSFAKYNTTIDNVSNTVGGLLGNFSKFGQLLGGAVKGVAELTKLHFEQADKLNKATDALKKLGTAGSFTGDQFLAMAHNAKLSANNLQLLVKPIQGLGPSLLALGNNTGIAAKNFADIAAYSDKQLAIADRLGISHEELIQSTADYIELQVKSGRATAAELKDKTKLNQLSFEYAQNLQVISKVTGMEATEAKKRMLAMSSEANWQLYRRDLERKGKGGQLAASEGFLQNISAQNYDENTKRAIKDYIAREGAIKGEDAATLARMGMIPQLQKALAAIRRGGSKEQGQDIAADLVQSLSGSIERTQSSVGYAARLDDKIGAKFGLGGQNVTQGAIDSQRNLREELNKARAQISAAGGPGKDPIADNRAKLAEIERDLAVSADKLLAASNPLISGFNSATVAAYGLAGALGAAAGALGGAGGGGGGGGAGAAASAAAGAAIGARGIRGIPGASWALPAAATMAAGAGADWLAGKAGVGGQNINAAQDEINWSKMTTGQKFQSGIARGIEKLGDFAFLGNISNQARSERIKKESEYLTGSSPGAPVASTFKKGDKQSFLSAMYGVLLAEAKKAGLPNPEAIASLGASQSALETGYGAHLSGGNNYFGIKDFNKKGGGQATQEFINGKWVTITAPFRQYGSMEESAADYIQFLIKNKRYGSVLAARTPEEAILAQGQTGYATDPNYANKLMSIHGSMAKAEKGGVFSGSRTGYPVELHGNELVAPLNPSSLLTKLLTTPESEMRRELTLNNNINSSQSSDGNVLVDVMMGVADKLDEVLYTLRTSQAIQDKLLQYSRA